MGSTLVFAAAFLGYALLVDARRRGVMAGLVGLRVLYIAAAGHQVVALTRATEPRPGRGWHAQLVRDTADPA
ncbi:MULTISPECIES: hypothetical protein [unclassified Streptomyces]|uniref:hypothetical protein n=1 Tax=unclassified Streptomyces TaxID=2593676 RepID=UPI001E6481CA|nr:hypothetical protein [Streptomyces sp. CB02980]MCB8907610.1 hypothetical protein [Streptomyces sp. CB02980]